MFWLCLAAAAGLAVPPRPIPPPKAAKADMTVGAFYFPGWAHADRWYCIKANPRVQRPLLGYYREGDPEVADWHIKWATEHGIGFFAFDFYTHNGSEMLEAALDGFLRSRFVGQMKFCLNWCNHAPAETMTAEHLREFADLVIPKYLTHPSYFTIDGKPLVIILSGYSFVKTLGVENARAAFADFEARCRKAGLPGVCLWSCEGEIVGEQALKDARAAGIQGFCLYNYPYAGTDMTGPGRYMEATYEDLTEQGVRLWQHWSRLLDGRFWPTVMPGWDRRPWLRDADLLRTGSTPSLFRKALERAKECVNADRVVMIEAWNEWGEGSVLEPSVEHGFAYLDAVREVFCPAAGRHRDLTPSDLGRIPPVFDVTLPRTTGWAFDYSLEGWTGRAIDHLRAEHGTLLGVTTSGDPQLTAPVNYVDCARHPQITIRMKIGRGEGGATASTGQVFWSTVDRAMRADASASFPVHLDGQWHDYSVRLADQPTWAGMADGLRIDPCDVPGASIAIDYVRFTAATR